MDIEKELQNLLDRYKIENDIRGFYFKEKGFFDSSNMWFLLFLLTQLNGFGIEKEEKE